MLANAPYIEYNSNFPIVSNIVYEWRLEKREKTEQRIADVSFFNSYMRDKKLNTIEVIQLQSNISDLTDAFGKVTEYTKHYPNIFANVSRDIVLMNYMEALNNIIEKNPDVIHTDISEEDECLFIYFQKGNTKVFFNMFYDDEVEALINISTEQHKYTIEDSIENGIEQMSVILRNNTETSADVPRIFAA